MSSRKPKLMDAAGGGADEDPGARHVGGALLLVSFGVQFGGACKCRYARGGGVTNVAVPRYIQTWTVRSVMSYVCTRGSVYLFPLTPRSYNRRRSNGRMILSWGRLLAKSKPPPVASGSTSWVYRTDRSPGSGLLHISPLHPPS